VDHISNYRNTEGLDILWTGRVGWDSTDPEFCPKKLLCVRNVGEGLCEGCRDRGLRGSECTRRATLGEDKVIVDLA
jgi:hypothetical protein